MFGFPVLVGCAGKKEKKKEKRKEKKRKKEKKKEKKKKKSYVIKQSRKRLINEVW